jgi:hypothetical protein
LRIAVFTLSAWLVGWLIRDVLPLVRPELDHHGAFA